MSKIGYGYGSEWHLLRYLGYHRQALNRAVESAVGGNEVQWFDFGCTVGGRFPDVECKGVGFLPPYHPATKAWQAFWPQSGQSQNWDAVGRLNVRGNEEWLLVEAKAHVRELDSHCGAKAESSRRKIEHAMEVTRADMGVKASGSWLEPYYQYANRLAMLGFLLRHGVGARLLFVYFCGEDHDGWECPRTAAEWRKPLEKMGRHLGLAGTSRVEERTHKLFLPIYR